MFELLVVMVILGMAMVAVSALYRSPSGGVQLKGAAQLTASRFRDLRAAAMSSGSERVATIDVENRAIRFSDGRPPLQLDRSIVLQVTAADALRNRSTAGVRFYPNGSSSGATIVMKAKGQNYEVRINWLTGRVSTAALQ